MEVNKEEALRCLNIAQRHRNAANLSSALKFAKKSVSLYSTPEGEAMVTVVEREILVSGTSNGENGSASGSGAATPNAEAGSSAAAGGAKNGARASGVEEHVSSAHQRPGHAASKASGSTSAAAGGADKGKKREYTAKQIEVVKRVKSCKHHEYYEILSLEKTCEENDVKRSYKKLALALHPDKNGAPGADEAFKTGNNPAWSHFEHETRDSQCLSQVEGKSKEAEQAAYKVVVSKAFQVLSDANLRAAFDSNPHSDPTQRGGGGGGGGGGMYRGGGMAPGFGGNGMYTEINPEDLFNAFFGGGGFGGGGFGGGQANGGFQAQFGGPQRRRTAGGNNTAANSSPLVALLPILMLCAFALLSALPSLFSFTTPDPTYSFEATRQYEMGRKTWNLQVPYWVNQEEWGKSDIWLSVPEGRRGEDRAALFSGKVKTFERGVENVYAQRLRNECERFHEIKERRVAQEAGFFGIGADHNKIREIRAEKSPACEQLKQWGMYRNQQYY